MLIAMDILLVFAVSAVLAIIYFYLKNIGALMARTRREVEEVFGRRKKEDGILPDSNGPVPGYRILIELVDPIAVAHRESAMARLVSEIAPHMVTRAVYRQLRKELGEALVQRNIDAKVSVLNY